MKRFIPCPPNNNILNKEDYNIYGCYFNTDHYLNVVREREKRGLETSKDYKQIFDNRIGYIRDMEVEKYHLLNQPKLTNGFISIIKYKQYSETEKQTMYTEQELYNKLHNLMTDIKLNGVKINDDSDLRLWFERNKHKQCTYNITDKAKY